MKKGLVAFFLLFVLATALVTGSYFKASAQTKPVKIRLAYVVDFNEMTPLLFLKRELLKHYGRSYTVDSIKIRGSSAIVPAFAAKAVDIGLQSYASFPTAILNARLDLKILADVFMEGIEGWGDSHFAVLENSGIRRLEDMRGKVFGTNALGSSGDIEIRSIMKKHGLIAQKDYKIVEVRFPNQEAMLRAGKIDAAHMILSFSNRAYAKGGLRRLFTAKEALGRVQLLFLAGRTEFLKKYQEAVKDFMEDFLYAKKWLLRPENREEALQLASTFTKIPLRALKPFLYLKGKGAYRHPDALISEEALQNNWDTMYKLGFIKQRLDVKDYVDMSFIREAKRRIQTR